MQEPSPITSYLRRLKIWVGPNNAVCRLRNECSVKVGSESRVGPKYPGTIELLTDLATDHNRDDQQLLALLNSDQLNLPRIIT